MSSDYEGPVYNKKIRQPQKKRRFNQGMDSRINLDRQLEEPAFIRKKRQEKQVESTPAWAGDSRAENQSVRRKQKEKQLEELIDKEVVASTELEHSNEAGADTYQVPFLEKYKTSTSASGREITNQEFYSELDVDYLTERLNQRSTLDSRKHSKVDYRPSLNSPVKVNQRNNPEKRKVSESLNNIGHSLETLSRMQSQYETYQNEGRLNRELLLRLVKRKDSFLLFD